MNKHTAILAGVFLSMLFGGAIGEKSTQAQVMPQIPGAPAGASVRANLDFGRVPLYFIPNEGQLDGKVAFYIQGGDKIVYFTPGGVTFSLGQSQKMNVGNEGTASGKLPSVKENAPARNWVVKLHFVGSNDKVKPVGEDKTGGVISYFKGKPKDWQAGLPAYSRIVYRDLWPGIDLAYSGTANRLKYEFIVHPGADPSRVRLAYRGVEGISVDQEGRLEVRTPAGGFKDDVPVAYQDIGGARKSVSLGYKQATRNRVDGEAFSEEGTLGGAHVYGFEVGDYDSTQPLVLDPALFIFSGYIGGMNNDQGRGIAVDGSGNVYVAGFTQATETSFPEAVGPDLSHNGDYDAFVAKVNASGTSLAYCGYIGGTQDDRGYGIAVDASGNAYVTGYALSTQTSFPVVAGSYDPVHNGLKDAFVAKVSAAGSALVYCTYLGGSADDAGYGIALDGSGNAFIAGYTGSSEVTFCEFMGPDITFNGGAYDAFVCKLNSSGTGRFYCGYIGGSGDDVGRAVAVDVSGNAYVTGDTDSNETTFPELVGPDLTYWQYSDAFVAKVNSSGTALAYCGYIAGYGYDWGYGIAVDAKGSAYVAGGSSGGLPTAVGPDLTINGTYPDAFVARVTPAGEALAYCGYIGGTAVEYGYGIAVDPSGNAYIAGYTNSNESSHGFPVLGGPDLINTGGDGFVAKVNASGSKLEYCGYVGGTDGGFEQCQGVAVDARGNAYVTGYTDAGDFPRFLGPDLTFNGFYDTDAFVSKVYSYWVPVQTNAIGDFDGDATDELAVDLGTNGAWLYDGGSWTQLSAMNPEGMIAANVDGDAADELFLEFSYAGLWLWNGGAMDLLSEENVETMAAGDLDADGIDELVVDFGTTGLWLYDGGAWNQLSGANVELMAVAQLDGSGGAEILGDFGTIGLWELSGGSWTQLSGVNLEFMAAGNTDGAGGQDLVGDFGPVGLWLLSGGAWEQWSGVNADFVITADIDGNGDSEVFGDFALTGLWLWDSGTWTIFSGLNVENMVASDTDGDGSDEMVADFAATGIWHWDSGTWNQISGVDPENLAAGDIDGDNAEEIIVDFGSLGLWLWNGGVWSQISAANPD
ncbi:MAG: hypothetical protein A2W03_03275 [Candidatus Aminicenantes bacterium RBG_16_63_16]|nr:MAG: hypothetical protein A2W03_03275 [Candidatus Aminicenantes bacterium RBG_16_63_16]